MRKVLLAIALVGALALPAAAAAAAGKQPSPYVICDASCNGGTGGWTGCTQQRADDSAGVGFLAWIDHYLVVSYCKQNGWITSISIVAHGCDTRGVASCTPGPAWMTSGGVGYGFASFEAHATWFLWTSPYYVSDDTLTLSVPLG